MLYEFSTENADYVFEGRTHIVRNEQELSGLGGRALF